jgi:hypothetical protein
MSIEKNEIKPQLWEQQCTENVITTQQQLHFDQ